MNVLDTSEDRSPRETLDPTDPIYPIRPIRIRLRTSALVSVLAAILVLLAAPGPASATSCREWNRLSDSQRYDRIDRMINDAISGQRGRSYNVNRNAIARCLDANAQNMFFDFSDLCSDSRTAGKNSIHGRFKNYIWDCVN
jgi:hypothetical protein